MTVKYTVFTEEGNTVEEYDVDVWNVIEWEEEPAGICLHWPKLNSEGSESELDHQIMLSDEDLEDLGYTKST